MPAIPQKEDAAAAAMQNRSIMSRLAHWGRIFLCLLTAGFVYPHAFSEGMDLSEMQRKTEGDLYKKKK